MRALLRLRTAVLLLVAGAALWLVADTLLVRHHDAFRHGQYESWETYPLGQVVAGTVWVIGSVLLLAGAAIAVALLLRRARINRGDLRAQRVPGVLLLAGTIALLVAGPSIPGCGQDLDRWVMWLAFGGFLAAAAALLWALVAGALRARSRRAWAGVLVVVALALALGYASVIELFSIAFRCD